MNLSGPEHFSSDVLVIGGGGAGLRAAIQAREKGASVVLVSKSQVGLGNNTVLSKAAFAAAVGWHDARDNPEVHAEDTLKAGRYINDPYLVRKITTRVLDEVSFLEKCGVQYSKKNGKIILNLSPGHSYHRHVRGVNRWGKDYTLPLKEHAVKLGVSLMERVFITRLLVQGGEAVGAVGIDRTGQVVVFSAPAVVLATGGLGQLYLSTNNAVGMTGDGYALAFNLGIPLRDMEFVQFYPTTIGGTRMLIYETFVFNCGAIIRNSSGEDVVARHGLQDPMVMTRDRLAQAIMKEILEGRDVDGGVIMDLNPVPEETLQQFSQVFPPAAFQGKREFVVVPSAHFGIGGIATDDEAHTLINGLFSCGEVVGGAHGANRLAGNALSEVFAMGAVAGENAAILSREKTLTQPKASEVDTERERLDALLGGEMNVESLLRSLKELMWFKVGIIRNESGLREAADEIRDIRSSIEKVRVDNTRDLVRRLELDNMLLVAEMITLAALERTESRGSHYREDYPDEDTGWRANLFVVNKNSEIKLDKKPAAVAVN